MWLRGSKREEDALLRKINPGANRWAGSRTGATSVLVVIA